MCVWGDWHPNPNPNPHPCPYLPVPTPVPVAVPLPLPATLTLTLTATATVTVTVTVNVTVTVTCGGCMVAVTDTNVGADELCLRSVTITRLSQIGILTLTRSRTHTPITPMPTMQPY